MEKENKTLQSYSKTLIILMIFCVLLSVATLAVVVYDRFIDKHEELETTILKPIGGSVKKNNDTFEVINMTKENQTVKIGKKEFKIKNDNSGEDGDILFINNQVVRQHGKNIYSERAYVTDDIIIFTIIGQCGEKIVYVINEDGKEISFSSQYQLNNLHLEDGALYAQGIVCTGEPYPKDDVVLKYANGLLNVQKAK